LHLLQAGSQQAKLPRVDMPLRIDRIRRIGFCESQARHGLSSFPDYGTKGTLADSL
jgi:hypothetical protein